MALTTSSRFQSITVSYYSIGSTLEQIRWVLDDTDQTRGSVYLNGVYPESGTVEYTDLGILQDLYASTDGFQDAADNAITPHVRSHLHGTTVESLEEFGSWNPFRAGSWEAFQQRLKIQGAASRGLISLEGSDDTERIEQTIGHEIVPRAASGDTFDYSLNRWNSLQFSTTNFILSLPIDADDEVNTANKLNEHPPIKAMLAYLESVRDMGITVGTDALLGTTFSSREFHIRQESSDTSDLEFIYSSFGWQTDGDSNYVSYQLTFIIVSGSEAINIDALSQIILDATGAISSTDLMIPPPTGNIDVPFKTRELDFGQHKALIARNDGLFYRGRNPRSGRPFELPVMDGAGLSYAFDELFYSGSKRQVSTHPFVNSIHFGENETADDVLQFPSPQRSVLSAGSHREYTVHNVSDQYTCEIQDWEDDALLTLYPGDFARFQLTLEPSGRNGKMIGQIIPQRRMIHSADYLGNFGGRGYWVTDEPRTLRMLPFSDSELAVIHEDAFTLGTATQPGGDQGDFEDDTGAWDYIGSFTVNMPGTMNFDILYQLRIDADSTNIGGYNGVRIYRVRGSSNTPVEIGEIVKPAISGDGAIQQYEFNHSIEVEAGDLYFAMHRYSNSSSWPDIYMDNFIRHIRLSPFIYREYD